LKSVIWLNCSYWQEMGETLNVFDYYQNNVIGGTNAFITTASSFNDFGDAIALKLEREITPTPEPRFNTVVRYWVIKLSWIRQKKIQKKIIHPNRPLPPSVRQSHSRLCPF
jgi:hypothetical protein